MNREERERPLEGKENLHVIVLKIGQTPLAPRRAAAEPALAGDLAGGLEVGMV